ncbi:protein of unknown function [Agreia sp. COWG]|nr:protein of unknown function [Agreia sp. COWG]
MRCRGCRHRQGDEDLHAKDGRIAEKTLLIASVALNQPSDRIQRLCRQLHR